MFLSLEVHDVSGGHCGEEVGKAKGQVSFKCCCGAI